MPTVCIVGFPQARRKRLEQAARALGVHLHIVPVDRGIKGRLRYVPDDVHAVARLDAYIDGLADGDAGYLLVLPYAVLPGPIAASLKAFKALGFMVDSPQGGRDGWIAQKGADLDDAFYDLILAKVKSTVLPAPADDPVGYFRAVAADRQRLLLGPRAFDTCPDVDPGRRPFLIRCADAFCALLDDGVSGRVDAFFHARGLDHAQTGGIRTRLRIYRDGREIHDETSSTHLKLGDKTTPQLAVRVYYQLLDIDGVQHIAILYVGIHPSRDLTVSYHM